MEKEILIHKEEDLRNKIYTIRGLKVMLDSDLAEIYGYSVKAFNQQVKNNIERFDEDFRFQLTEEENRMILRSKILTLEQGQYSKFLPYAFTEQGIYMFNERFGINFGLNGDFYFRGVGIAEAKVGGYKQKHSDSFSRKVNFVRVQVGCTIKTKN